MTLSERVGKHLDRSRESQAPIEASAAKKGAQLFARRADLENQLASARGRIGQGAAVREDGEAQDRVDTRKLVSDAFASLGEDSATRHARWSAKRAGRAADDAAVNAFDSIDFALHAIQQAELAVIEAAIAREEADRTALEVAAEASLSQQ